MISSTFWRNRSVLVTGSTGLVGSWLVKRLHEEGANVICLVRDWVPESELVRSRLIEQVRVVRGDILDQSLLERILGEYEVVTVFHLAAQAIVTVANRNPLATLETNVAGTWRLLEACRRNPGVEQIVIASSDKAYGDHDVLPYCENMPLRGRHPYDVSKSCADLVAQMYASTYGLPVAITRCGNLFGGGDLNWNRIVPSTIRSALRSERPIIRSDGRHVRDYLYIEDAAAAYTLLAEKMAENPDLKGQAFNFANERPVAVLELVAMILSLMNSELAPDVRNEATHEIREQYLSADKARTALGWRAQYSLTEGLSRTVAWYTEFLQ